MRASSMTEAFRLTKPLFDDLVSRLATAGYADEDIQWSENVTAPDNAEDFARETIWVICNSGMKNTVARLIYDRVIGALSSGRRVMEVFRHAGKAQAIERIWGDRATLHLGYLAAEDKLAFCRSLPWIGDITKFHLAKNFGLDVAKPDVHLQRLADLEGGSVAAMCERLAAETGFRVATVDLLVWRACAVGILNSRTGAIAS